MGKGGREKRRERERGGRGRRERIGEGGREGEVHVGREEKEERREVSNLYTHTSESYW